MTAFQIFMEKIKKGVSEYCGESCKVTIDEVRKNNGMLYHGITINEKGSNISPTIYVDGLYQEYMEGMSLAEILKRVISLYEKHKIEQNVDMQFLTDFSWAKKQILYKLVGYDSNRELLKEIPHVRFLDMALVFYYQLQEDTLGDITVLIKNSICKNWAVEADELLLLAKENTPMALPASIMNMQKMIADMGLGEDIMRDEEEAEYPAMYVMTNSKKLYGACCMLYPHLLKQFSRKTNSNLYILPSSIHEVILVPEKKGINGREFERIVKEINRTQLAWEEVLSDSVYYYDRNTEEIRKI